MVSSIGRRWMFIDKLLEVAAVLSWSRPARRLARGRKALERGEHATALRALRPLVRKGDPVAQTILGSMLNGGEGMPQDFTKAVRLYAQAAETGHADAQYHLGIMIADGDGVPQDDVTSLMWFYLASAQGHRSATEEVDIVTSSMPADDIEEARARAEEWTTRHKEHSV